jgi:hypothetical protein
MAPIALVGESSFKVEQETMNVVLTNQPIGRGFVVARQHADAALVR